MRTRPHIRIESFGFEVTLSSSRRLVGAIAATLLLALALGMPSAAARPGGTNRLDHAMRGPGVTVWYAPGEEQIAQWAGQLVTRKREELATRLGLPVPPRIEVLVAETRIAFEEAVRARTGERPPLWALAVAVGRETIAVHTGRLRAGSNDNLDAVVAHELAHLVLSGAGPTLPRWLNEGLAMWAADETIGERDANRIAKHARAGQLRSLGSLTSDFPEHERDAQDAYLQSLSTVELLAERYGDDGIRRLLRAVRDGAPFPAALRDALGLEFTTLEADVQARIANRYQLLYDLLNPEALLSFAAILAILAFVRYRVRRRRILAGMDEPPEATDAVNDGGPRGPLD